MNGKGSSMLLENEVLSLDHFDSEADYILFSHEEGILSEHFTPSEAAMAYYQIASRSSIGQRLPAIYRRADDRWVLAN